MFTTDLNANEYFSDTRNIEEQILELRSIVIELEFKREEMCEGLDRLHRAVNSISLNTSDAVNK